MLDLLNEFKITTKHQAHLLDKITEQLKDKEVPLDTRWEAYLQVSGHLPTCSWYLDFPEDDDGNEVVYYDDLGIDRYQTFNVSDIFSYIGDRYTGDKEVELKEFILESGYGACINDW